jgi:hypothetical protein
VIIRMSLMALTGCLEELALLRNVTECSALTHLIRRYARLSDHWLLPLRRRPIRNSAASGGDGSDIVAGEVMARNAIAGQPDEALLQERFRRGAPVPGRPLSASR